MTTIPQEDLFELVQAPIDVPALHRRVRGLDDGAIVIFDGFVRNESHGRATKYLDYEAYEPMALGKMREICHPPRSHRAPARKVGNWRNQHTHRCQRPAPGCRFRCLPIRYRHPEEDRPHLEKGVL
jgi:MoaE protein